VIEARNHNGRVVRAIKVALTGLVIHG